VSKIYAPSHYTVGGIETIDYMDAKSTSEEFKGYLRLSVIKYLSRVGHKDDELQEYKKAQVFLGWLVNYLETGAIRPPHETYSKAVSVVKSPYHRSRPVSKRMAVKVQRRSRRLGQQQK
jgi:hypothetical protein